MTAPQERESLVAAGQIAEQSKAVTADSARVHQAAQAPKLIEGEHKAREYPARLHVQQADPDDLALIVAALCGAGLRGFCAAITKAFRGGGA